MNQKLKCQTKSKQCAFDRETVILSKTKIARDKKETKCQNCHGVFSKTAIIVILKPSTLIRHPFIYRVDSG